MNTTPSHKSDFIVLFSDVAPIIIRADSIVEVWHDIYEYKVTVVYKHPARDELVEHEERFKSSGGAYQRFYIILNALGIFWQERKFNEVCSRETITGDDDYERAPLEK